jgi:hypothetical protein
MNSDSVMVFVELDSAIQPCLFQWSNGETINPMTAISGNTYFVTITDVNLCTVLDTVLVEEIEDLEIALILTQPTCPDSIYAIIYANVISGNEPISFNWSDLSTSDSLTATVANTLYTVTVTSGYGCQKIDTAFISSTQLLIITAEITPPVCLTSIGGSVDIEVFGGVSPYSYYWETNGLFYSYDEDINGLLTGYNYDLTVTDLSGCHVNYSVTVPEASLLIYYNIIGQGCNGIQDTQYLTNSTVCIDSIIGGTPPYFFTWSYPGGSVSGDTVTCLFGESDGNWFDLNVVDADSTCYGFVHDTVYSDQDILLKVDWSYFSTYLKFPNNSNISSYFESQNLVSEVHICKNELGNVWWPEWASNGIGDFQVGKGYQIKMASERILHLNGSLACPEDNQISMNNGWGLVGYIRTTSGHVTDLLAPIVAPYMTVGSLELMKNYSGGVYWPYYGLMTMQYMYPGEGYQYKMNWQESFFYPPNSQNLGTKSLTALKQFEYSIEGLYINTDNFMIVGLPEAVWEESLLPGTELSAYGEKSQLVGKSVYTPGFSAIVIYGDDFYTPEIIENLSEGETFVIQAYSPGQKSLKNLKINKWQSGDGYFSNKKISVAGIPDQKIPDNDPDKSVEFLVYPNPGNGHFTIKIRSDIDQHGSFIVIAKTGELIIKSSDCKLTKEWQYYKLDMTGNSSGSYHLIIQTKTGVFAGEIILLP